MKWYEGHLSQCGMWWHLYYSNQLFENRLFVTWIGLCCNRSCRHCTYRFYLYGSKYQYSNVKTLNKLYLKYPQQMEKEQLFGRLELWRKRLKSVRVFVCSYNSGSAVEIFCIENFLLTPFTTVLSEFKLFNLLHKSQSSTEL